MLSHNWKRAAKVGLVMCALSLPVWAVPKKGDWGHGHGHGGCGGGGQWDCRGGGGGGQNVPEGGSLLGYAGLTGVMIAGGLTLARKSRSL